MGIGNLAGSFDLVFFLVQVEIIHPSRYGYATPGNLFAILTGTRFLLVHGWGTFLREEHLTCSAQVDNAE